MATTTHEIVHVRSAHFLVDSAWRICPYSTRTGHALEPGYYLTLRSHRSGEYDRRTRYYGPFENRVLAEQMAASAVYLGVVEADGGYRFPADALDTAPRRQHERARMRARRRSRERAGAWPGALLGTDD